MQAWNNEQLGSNLQPVKTVLLKFGALIHSATVACLLRIYFNEDRGSKWLVMNFIVSTPWHSFPLLGSVGQHTNRHNFLLWIINNEFWQQLGSNLQPVKTVLLKFGALIRSATVAYLLQIYFIEDRGSKWLVIKFVSTPWHSLPLLGSVGRHTNTDRHGFSLDLHSSHLKNHS